MNNVEESWQNQNRQRVGQLSEKGQNNLGVVEYNGAQSKMSYGWMKSDDTTDRTLNLLQWRGQTEKD